jgi:hypothetical protein
MNRSLLFAATSLIIICRPVSASAAPFCDPALVSYAQLSWRAQLPAQPDERFAFSPERIETVALLDAKASGKTFRKTAVGFLHNVVLLAVAGLVMAMAAVGMRTLWTARPIEYPLYEGL